MSLPTPPGTSHREKRGPRFERVSWSETTEYHAITNSPPRTLSTRTKPSKAGPSRSILKKTVPSVLPPPEEVVKESTPEPEDPLTNLHYLDHPVAQILTVGASLRDLIQAYSILAARLRSSVTGNTDADASWPLFQPLRKHRDSFVQAVVRDVRQVFVDPLEGSQDVTDCPSPREPPSTSTLPSPRDSPKKQKRGMSAEQVKRARDLCGVSHAVLRLFSVVFTVPSLYNLFDEEELGYMFTEVLAIPLANELPTPNARKTCALVIWLIQIQRLPIEVLEPTKDRIAYALRRGIDGELGKEGKKGSTSDGLKAIHDLALYQPALFVPAFTPILGPILSNLLAPTLLMRSQACHALGGLAMAAASLPPSEAHTRASTIVASRLIKTVDTSPTTPSKKRADASPSKDSILVRTLRTTLQAADPKHSAQGPVWAFSVIAHLVVLLGPTVYLHSELTRTILALFTLGMRHVKSSVRALGCLAWRTMSWAFFRPPHVRLTIDTETDGDDDSATEDDCITERRKHDDSLRECFRYLLSVVDMGAGIATVGALLGQEIVDDVHIIGALRVLRSMSRKGGQTCKDAMELTRRLLGAAAPSSCDMSTEKEWDNRKLLSPNFFSANPGLLTAEWKTLSSAVKPLLEDCPQIQDVRMLTLDEIISDGMWNEFLSVWKHGLSVLKLSFGSLDIPDEIREIWHSLLKYHAAPLIENNDQEGLGTLARNAKHVLVDLLSDEKLNFTMREDVANDQITTSPVKPVPSRNDKTRADELLMESRWNYVVKLFLVRDLMTIASAVFPAEIFADLSESMLRFLNLNEEIVVGDVQCTDDVRAQWACICAETAFACGYSVVQAFWNNTLRKGRRRSPWDAEVLSAVWYEFVDRWKSFEIDGSRSWETAIVLLSAPFVEPSCWDMASEDIEAWDSLLRRAIEAALDHGIDATTLVDHIAGAVAGKRCPAETLSVRIADLLLSNVEIVDARQVPTELFEFANDTLNSAYPPAPRHKVMCMWLIRSLTRVIDLCPSYFCLAMLELLVDGLRTWLTDDLQICSQEDYSSDLLPLYQTVLVSIQSLPRNGDVLEVLAPILVAPFYGRKDRHVGSVDAFAEYWQATYAEIPEPSSGYPEEILHCLDAVAQARLEEEEDVAKVEDMTTIHGEPPSPSVFKALKEAEVQTPGVSHEECVESDEDEGSVVVPSPATLARLSAPLLHPVIFSHQPPSDALLPMSSTSETSPSPDRSVVRTIPRRPHKSPVKESGVVDFAPMSSPTSSVMDSSPIRAPTTPKRSPTKGQAAKNKENMTPLPIASLTERLAVRSPLLLESILGKRHRNEDAEDVAALNESAFKKGRLEESPLAPSAFPSVRVHMVMHDSSNTLEQLPMPVSTIEPPKTRGENVDPEMLESSESDSETTAVEITPTPILRKRKGVFLDAVEVPSLENVFRTRRRMSTQVAGLSTAVDIADETGEALHPTLRRTRSATKLLGVRAGFEKLEWTPKRPRVSRAMQLREEAGEMSSPLRFIRDAPLFDSDDSIMVSSPVEAPDLPPSDDDPHIGQVTPHRLVSPALRRVQHIMFDSDPPSDDSNMSNSPSRDRVMRKIARLGSEQRTPLKLTPLGIRPPSLSAMSSSPSALGSDR